MIIYVKLERNMNTEYEHILWIPIAQSMQS